MPSFKFLVGLMVVAASSKAAVEFTPRYADILADGVPQHSLYLQDGPLKAFLRIPSKWDVKDEAGTLCLTSLEHSSARVDIRKSAVHLPAAIDDDWIKLITPQLIKSLPPGAEKAFVLETKVNPILVLSWKSFEFQISYEIAGAKFLRSICFISLHTGDSAEMLTSGQETDVGPARAAGFAMLSSWLEPPAKIMNRMVQ